MSSITMARMNPDMEDHLISNPRFKGVRITQALLTDLVWKPIQTSPKWTKNHTVDMFWSTKDRAQKHIEDAKIELTPGLDRVLQSLLPPSVDFFFFSRHFPPPRRRGGGYGGDGNPTATNHRDAGRGGSSRPGPKGLAQEEGTPPI